jgi:hypothetical protein
MNQVILSTLHCIIREGFVLQIGTTVKNWPDRENSYCRLDSQNFVRFLFQSCHKF